MTDLQRLTAGPRSQQRGASAVEYALIVALVAAVIVGAVIVLGDKVFGLFQLSNDTRW